MKFDEYHHSGSHIFVPIRGGTPLLCAPLHSVASPPIHPSVGIFSSVLLQLLGQVLRCVHFGDLHLQPPSSPGCRRRCRFWEMKVINEPDEVHPAEVGVRGEVARDVLLIFHQQKITHRSLKGKQELLLVQEELADADATPLLLVHSPLLPLRECQGNIMVQGIFLYFIIARKMSARDHQNGRIYGFN